MLHPKKARAIFQDWTNNFTFFQPRGRVNHDLNFTKTIARNAYKQHKNRKLNNIMFSRCVCIYSPANVIFYAKDGIHCAILHIAGDNIKTTEARLHPEAELWNVKEVVRPSIQSFSSGNFPSQFCLHHCLHQSNSSLFSCSLSPSLNWTLTHASFILTRPTSNLASFMRLNFGSRFLNRKSENGFSCKTAE